MTTEVLNRMKAAEAAQGGAAAAAKMALVKGPKEEGGRVLLNVEALEPALETKVRKWYHDLNGAMGDFSKAGLKIGQILHEARETLKPLGIWIAFLNRVPGLSPKTGDRFIKRWEMAQKKLPASVLALAITTGTALAGETEKEPFGRYSRAVKRVGPPPKDTGEVDKDVEKAQGWFAQVLTVYNQQKKRARAQAAEVDPAERMAERLVSAARGYVDDKEGQVSFLKRVLQLTLKELGYRDLIVTQSEKHKSGSSRAA